MFILLLFYVYIQLKVTKGNLTVVAVSPVFISVRTLMKSLLLNYTSGCIFNEICLNMSFSNSNFNSLDFQTVDLGP